MAQIGKRNSLKVISEEDFGFYLDAAKLGRALLKPSPDESLPELGAEVDVFLYYDKSDTLIATFKQPKIEVGQVAILKIADINSTGAFAEWGLPKNLLIPYAQQSRNMVKGLHYPVFCYEDKNNGKLVGSAKLSKHLAEITTSLEAKQKVQLLICGKSKLGYKAVINNTYLGLIHHEDAFRSLKLGDQIDGYVKDIREDGKINLAVHLANSEQLGVLASKVFEDLQLNKSTNLTDKSPPDLIYKKWNVSKGSYKKALGKLYKQRLIEISKDQIKLIDS